MFWRAFEHSQVYHPHHREWDTTPSALGMAAEDVTLETGDGTKLSAWFFPAKPESARAQWCALICHGNAGNISHRLGLCGVLLDCGASVLVFDYRGYGRSEGKPGEEGTYRDAQAAHRWLTQKGFSAQRIIGYGESLGGGVVAELACREKLGGIILQSVFTSIPDIGAELFPWLPVRWLSTIRYDVRGKLPRVNIPVLILHSRQDRLVRFHHAERNFAAANEPKLLCELQGDHNDIIWREPEYRAGIEKFLETAEAQPGAI